MLRVQDLTPDWILSGQVEDGAFEAAYAASKAWERALVKAAVAGMYAWLEPRGIRWAGTEQITGQGLRIYTAHSPRNWAVVHIPKACAAPSLIVASVIPLLAAGVWPVIVVLEENPAQQTTLMTLELSGVETAFALSKTKLQDSLCYFAGLKESGPGIVVSIDTAPASIQGLERAEEEKNLLLGLPCPRQAGIWLEDEGIDLQALAFAHPELEFLLGSKHDHRQNLTGRWKQINGRWADFLGKRFDAAWVPAGRIQDALTAFSLVFGPGQESLWIWPWYTTVLAGYTRLGFSKA